MKKLNLLLMLFVVFGTAVACSDDDDSATQEPVTNEQTENISNFMRGGVWRITNYMQNETDMSAQFEGYNFIFGNQNEVIATNGMDATNGTWSVTVHTNDAGTEDIRFGMNFDTPQEFSVLRGSWNILERTDSMIKLVEINNNTNHVTFEKN